VTVTSPAPLTLTPITTDAAFRPTLGPFPARRDAVRTVGGPIRDDDAKPRLAVGDDSGDVRGFAAVAVHGRRTVVKSLYVHGPAWRDNARSLVAAAARLFGPPW
jgi:hypothetical protein